MTNRITRTIVSVVAAAFFAVPVAAQEVSEMEVSEISWEPVLDAGAEAITAVIDLNNLSAEQQVLLEEVSVWRQYLPSAGDDWLGEYHELMVDQDILGPDGSLCSLAREGWCYDLFVAVNLAAGTNFGRVPYSHSALLGESMWFPDFTAAVPSEPADSPTFVTPTGGTEAVVDEGVIAVAPTPNSVEGAQLEGSFVSDTFNRFASLFVQVRQLTDANATQAAEAATQREEINALAQRQSGDANRIDDLMQAVFDLGQSQRYLAGLVVITLVGLLLMIGVIYLVWKNLVRRDDKLDQVVSHNADVSNRHNKRLQKVEVTAAAALATAHNVQWALYEDRLKKLGNPFDPAIVFAGIATLRSGDVYHVKLERYHDPHDQIVKTVLLRKEGDLYTIVGLSRRDGKFDQIQGVKQVNVIAKLLEGLEKKRLYRLPVPVSEAGSDSATLVAAE